MQHGPTKSRYFNPDTKTWSPWMSRTDAMTAERAMFLKMQTGTQVTLLSTRMNTRKPSTDARYRGNAEKRAA